MPRKVSISASIEELAEMYNSGLTLKQIGAKFGTSYQPIHTLFKRHGIKARHPGPQQSPVHHLNNALQFIKARARNRGQEWALTDGQFIALISQPCHYCGMMNSNRIKANSRYKKDFVYNGIDRKDSSLGYTPENSLPSCKYCNLAKRERPYEAFIEWVHHVSEFLKRRESSAHVLQKS